MSRGVLVEIHIADLHFTAFDPKTQYEILMEQFIQPISVLPKIDIISVDGDIFDHKVMANSDGAMYASMLIDQLVSICKAKSSTLVLLQGTYSHDANQLKLFYHYMSDPSVDVRVVTDIRFEDIKGARILCIPELYGVPESEYKEKLFDSGLYDSVFMHGTIKGAVYGNNVGNGRLFGIQDFINCKGPIISGHVHKPGCFEGYFYYTGCPYRWKFGEEEEKGYLTVLHDLDSGGHYVNFNPIVSFRYDTIFVDELISNDPKVVIEWINNLKESKGIDYIKVRFRYPINGADKTIISNYYRNSPTTTVEFLTIQEQQKQDVDNQLRESEYDYLTNDKYTDLEKFVMYVNQQEGDQFITLDDLKKLLEEDI